MSENVVGDCLHCGRFYRRLVRGLCQRCYREHRDEYPRLGGTKSKYEAEESAFTEEQVEQIVREQEKDLPAWWESDRRREDKFWGIEMD